LSGCDGEDRCDDEGICDDEDRCDDEDGEDVFDNFQGNRIKNFYTIYCMLT